MNKQYVIERLKEPSTWRGIILVVTACGVPVAPALGEQIIAVGIAIAGLVGIFAADPK